MRFITSQRTCTCVDDSLNQTGLHKHIDHPERYTIILNRSMSLCMSTLQHPPAGALTVHYSLRSRGLRLYSSIHQPERGCTVVPIPFSGPSVAVISIEPATRRVSNPKPRSSALTVTGTSTTLVGTSRRFWYKHQQHSSSNDQ
jgi:hypothetical protein